MGQIRGFFRSDFIAFGAGRSEKAPNLSHLGPIWPTLEPNLPSLVKTDAFSTLQTQSDTWELVEGLGLENYAGILLPLKRSCHVVMLLVSIIMYIYEILFIYQKLDYIKLIIFK